MCNCIKFSKFFLDESNGGSSLVHFETLSVLMGIDQLHGEGGWGNIDGIDLHGEFLLGIGKFISTTSIHG